MSVSPAAGAQPSSTAIACSLSADAHHERLGRWHALLADAGVAALPDGFQVELSAARAGDLASLIVAEQECCPFFSFTLNFHGARLQLLITATKADLVSDLLPPEHRP